MKKQTRLISLLLAALMVLAVAAGAFADSAPIKAVKIIVTPPKAGTSSLVHPTVAVPSGADYVYEASGWYEEDGTPAEPPQDYAFEAGKTYIMWTTVKANEGFYFSEDAAISVEGGKLQDSGTEIHTEPDYTYSAVHVEVAVTIPKEESEYKITFNANGGKGSMGAIKVKSGASATLAKNRFTRKGYVFRNWNTKKNGSGKSYKNGAKITVSANTVLYAQWDKITISLKKVTVKNSAKKLVLSATLNIGGKPASGKAVAFVFNGKKYTAKTDKKGVAKVTVKKAVLKKLKAGKKVAIQVSYADVTAKISVKVKK